MERCCIFFIFVPLFNSLTISAPNALACTPQSNIWLKFSMWSVTGVLVVVGTISAFDTLSQIFVSQGSE